MPSKRKPYNEDAGYIASRKCADGGHAVIYDRDNGGDWIDSDARWMVVKYPGGFIINAQSRRDAYFLMKDAAGEQLNKWWEDSDAS